MVVPPGRGGDKTKIFLAPPAWSKTPPPPAGGIPPPCRNVCVKCRETPGGGREKIKWNPRGLEREMTKSVVLGIKTCTKKVIPPGFHSMIK